MYNVIKEVVPLNKHSNDTTFKGGEDHPNAKLKKEDVEQIKALVASGERQGTVAAKFKVARSTVCEIVNGKIWK